MLPCSIHKLGQWHVGYKVYLSSLMEKLKEELGLSAEQIPKGYFWNKKECYESQMKVR